MQETRVQSLGWEDPLEEEIAIYSSIFCLKSPMDRGAWRATVHGVPKGWPRLMPEYGCGHKAGWVHDIQGTSTPTLIGLFLHRGCTDIICCVFLFLAIVGYVAVGIIGKQTRGWDGGSRVGGQATASGAEVELVVEPHHLNIPGSFHSLDPWRPSKGDLPH